MTNENLALALSRCESESDIIELLKNENLWENPNCWRAFGDNDNNFSTIGNQQSSPDAALVEKLINSIDAMLMKECQIMGIDPKSSEAPNSIYEAIEKFYGIKDGSLINFTTSQRTELSKKGIFLAATGDKVKPCFSIIDNGEGQSSTSLPDTILSLNKDNKLKVKFVQGKFNMGGTGVLQFCGRNNMQLIISKRCPQILKPSESPDWCFTLIRRESEAEGRKSSRYMYLTNDDKSIKTFNSGALGLIPYRDNKYDTLSYGMFIKLFEYNIPGYSSRIAPGNLYFRMSTLLPQLAYPIRFNECRSDFKSHTIEQTLTGLLIRLMEDKNDNIEENFSPQSMSFTVEGEKMSASLYVFKKTATVKQYKDDEGIIFSINGQTHGSIPKTIFRKARLDYLQDSILIIIDCSNFTTRLREDLFMNSRDRLRKSEIRDKIEEEIIECLKNNETLLKLQDQRRQESLAEKISDDKPLQEILAGLMKKSPTLSRIFLKGLKLQNPFNLVPAEDTTNYNGKKSPSFFTILDQKKNSVFIKHAHYSSKFKIKFKTDVENEYFSRKEDCGIYILESSIGDIKNHNMSLNSGTAILTITLPEEVNIGDKILYKISVYDDYMVDPIINEFQVIVEKEIIFIGGGNGSKVHPNGEAKEDGKNLTQSGLALPEIKEIYKDDWHNPIYSFLNINSDTALSVRQSTIENVYDFYINMSNKCLETEIKPNLKNEVKVKMLKSKYKYGMVLIGISIINYLQVTKKEQKDETYIVQDEVEKITAMLSPVLIPIIDSLSELEPDDILG